MNDFIRIDAHGRHWHRTESPDVAIIGMACLFPKAADVHGYWHNILNKVNALQEIPRERWDWELYYDRDHAARDKINSRWGGFIPDVLFDPLRFGMPPRSLPAIEPLHLLLLMCAHTALEDAGYLDRPFDRSRTSVVLGAGGDSELAQRYSFRSALTTFFGQRARDLVSECGDGVPDWCEDTLPGVLMNVAAGRVANRFDLGGSNYAVDAACASGLAALRAGVLELRARESDMVLVGGADTIMNPYAYTCFSKTATLSPSGRSRPFDTGADGIVLSEGVATILIKRLDEARQDGDKVYAVIKGIASSSDGKGKGLAAPRQEGQVLALRRAYRQAGVSPHTVELIEAHATGTSIGDRSECEALTQVFSESGAAPKSCALGSVKSMIGHPKRAAALAGLIKAALALHHKVLPPTMDVEDPIPELFSSGNPLYLNPEPTPWIRQNGEPRRAGVNSFGFGGTNFHALLEESTNGGPAEYAEPALREWPAEVLLLRGNSRSDLVKKIEQLRAMIQRSGSVSLRDAAFHLAATPPKDGERCLSLVCRSLSDLEHKLDTASKDLLDESRKSIWRSDGTYYVDDPLKNRGKIAFLFPGQGSQYCGMLAHLAIQFPAVRSTFEGFNDTLRGRLEKPLSRYVYPPFAFSTDELKGYEKELMQTHVAQPAMGAADLAMHKLLARLGVQPDIVAGHSYGEYVALHAAGLFSEESLALLSEARGRLIAEAAASRRGGMVAVRGDETSVRMAVGGIEDLWVVSLNSPEQTVISGAEEAVTKAMDVLRTKGLHAVRIPTACAFHSPLVSAAQEGLGRLLRETSWGCPTRTVFSNTTASPYPEGREATVELLARHVVEPVDFMGEIEGIYKAGARIFVEVGAGNVLTKLVGKILGARPHRAIHTDQKGESALERLQHVVAQLRAEGVAMDLGILYEGRGCRHLQAEGSAPASEAEEMSKTAWIVQAGKAFPVRERAGGVSVPTCKPLAGISTGNGDNAGKSPESTPDIREERDRSAMANLRKDKRLPERTAEGDRQSDAGGRTRRTPCEADLREPDPVSSSETPEDPVRSLPGPAHGDETVILEFQKLMNRFLDTQRAVMLAYLSGHAEGPPSLAEAHEIASPPDGEPALPAKVETTGGGNPTPPLPADRLENKADDIAVTRPVFTEMEADPVVKDPARHGEIESLVLLIVEERTGYPRDVLALDLDLEADLGLDSIKKVEIFGAVRERIEQETGRPLQIDQEEASRTTTLKGIIDLVHKGIGASLSKPAHAEDGGTVRGESTPLGKEEITETVLALVEERTGYPKDVLDLDLDLEADLGLDSIKKVEIFGALRERIEQETGIPLQIDQEEASRTTTLKGIIDLVHKGIGASLPKPAHPRDGGTATSGSALLGKEEITETVLALVEERTGYPRDVLSLDLDLEADLGLDSIKKVEIFGLLRERIEQKTGSPLQIDQEEASRATTLKGIIDLVFAEMGAHSPDGDGKENPLERGEGARMEGIMPMDPEPHASNIKRLLLEIKEKPFVSNPLPFSTEQTIIVTSLPQDPVAACVVENLKHIRRSVVSLQQGQGNGGGDGERYQTNLASFEDLSRTVEQIRHDRGPISGLIHLVPLAGPKPVENMTVVEWKNRLDIEVKSLFYMTKILADDLLAAADNGGGSVVAATRMGGSFASDPSICPDTGFFPGSGGVPGFLKSLAAEWPRSTVRCVDLDYSEAPEVLGKQVVREFANASGDVEIGYRKGTRYAIGVKEAALPLDGRNLMQIDASCVLLITGGARGITSTVALELAKYCQPTIVLVGRSPEPKTEESEETRGIDDRKKLKAFLRSRLSGIHSNVKPIEIERAYKRIMADREVCSNIGAMRKFGARVAYFQADVRDGTALGDVIDRIYEKYGRIDGVVHGAGVIEDKRVLDKDLRSFDRVFDTKADSLFWLTQKLRPESLRFFALFSSAAGTFGNQGQSDYSAVNQVYDKMATYLDRIWPARVVSLAWGPWESMGMVSRELQRLFRDKGICLIPRSLGPKLFLREIIHGEKGHTQVVFGNVEEPVTEPLTRRSETAFPFLSEGTSSR